MRKTNVRMCPSAMAYLEPYGRARGIGRTTECLQEVVRLSLGGPRKLGPEWSGIVLADAAARREFEPQVDGNRRSWRCVKLQSAELIKRLRGVCIASGETLTDAINRLVLERVYGRGFTHDHWRGLECWIKPDPVDSLPVLHVLRRGRGHLATRKLTAEDQAAAQADASYLSAMVEAVVAESELVTRKVAPSDHQVRLTDEHGYICQVPSGGIFWPWMDQEDCYAVAYGAPGCMTPVVLTDVRGGREGYLWARRVASVLNARWCDHHASLALHERTPEDFCVAPIIDMDPMGPLEVDDED